MTTGGGSGPLALGSGGITQSAANGQAFRTVQVLLGADQTWKLANGAGALTFAAGLDTSGGPGGAGRALTFGAATTTGSGNMLGGSIAYGRKTGERSAGPLRLGGMFG